MYLDWSFNDQKYVLDSQLMKITSVVNRFTLFIDDGKGKLFWDDDDHSGTVLGVNLKINRCWIWSKE